MIFGAVFVVGACIGSFLNVCIYRIPLGRSIVRPGSFCPSCKEFIPFYLNLPILSYVLLRGRCRNCGHPISPRYPIVEAMTGGFAVLLLSRFGFTPSALFWLGFVCVLTVVSFIDLDHQIIPDCISLPGIPVFATSFLFLPGMAWTDVLTGILAGGGILYAVALFYYLARKQEGMGGGDIKLLAMIGAATGFKGVLFTILTGSLLGTLAGLGTMIATGTFSSRLKIPFGPFLSMGAVLYVFLGESSIRWYLDKILG